MSGTAIDIKSPEVGDFAPDLTLPDSAGEPRRLGEFWAASRNGCVLVFLRHFG